MHDNQKERNRVPTPNDCPELLTALAKLVQQQEQLVHTPPEDENLEDLEPLLDMAYTQLLEQVPTVEVQLTLKVTVPVGMENWAEYDLGRQLSELDPYNLKDAVTSRPGVNKNVTGLAWEAFKHDLLVGYYDD